MPSRDGSLEGIQDEETWTRTPRDHLASEGSQEMELHTLLEPLGGVPFLIDWDWGGERLKCEGMVVELEFERLQDL
eukprot:CAMPEP_0184501274 /NCGR_PEP_ID=MMETSP0113_2-20130426/47180_1 /TAXON_ID=91329 /ORGANISM="Norrisiella sphaerica, Strain BC52" /LENGTH=75 /DNA_ID=CAMNT_0026889983 /DNA_START=195 /DNA_END=419 /DNA_ORIENTATION=-